jgi:hypothetical protein
MSHLLGCAGGKWVPLAHQPDAQAVPSYCWRASVGAQDTLVVAKNARQ